MKSESKKVVKYLVAMAFVVVMVLCIKEGWYHLTEYYCSDNYPTLDVNAYVGGDAYNYIINYIVACAYFLLALMAEIAAAVIATRKVN